MLLCALPGCAHLASGACSFNDVGRSVILPACTARQLQSVQLLWRVTVNGQGASTYDQYLRPPTLHCLPHACFIK